MKKENGRDEAAKKEARDGLNRILLLWWADKESAHWERVRKEVDAKQ